MPLVPRICRLGAPKHVRRAIVHSRVAGLPRRCSCRLDMRVDCLELAAWAATAAAAASAAMCGIRRGRVRVVRLLRHRRGCRRRALADCFGLAAWAAAAAAAAVTVGCGTGRGRAVSLLGSAAAAAAPWMLASGWLAGLPPLLPWPPRSSAALDAGVAASLGSDNAAAAAAARWLPASSWLLGPRLLPPRPRRLLAALGESAGAAALLGCHGYRGRRLDAQGACLGLAAAGVEVKLSVHCNEHCPCHRLIL